jgi:hypothetical protein
MTDLLNDYALDFLQKAGKAVLPLSLPEGRSRFPRSGPALCKALRKRNRSSAAEFQLQPGRQAECRARKIRAFQGREILSRAGKMAGIHAPVLSLPGGSRRRRRPDPENMAVRNNEWKYITYPGTSEMDELYNPVKDPYEMKNLISDPKHADVVKRMKTRMTQLVEETK